jgi:hypothetical protein
MTRATRAQADEKRTVPPSAPLFVYDCSPLKSSRGTGLVKRTIGPTRSQKISSALCAPGAETLNIVALVIARRASPAAHTAAWRTVPPAWDAPPTSWMETYSAGAGCGAASRSGLESNRSGPETKWPLRNADGEGRRGMEEDGGRVRSFRTDLRRVSLLWLSDLDLSGPTELTTDMLLSRKLGFPVYRNMADGSSICSRRYPWTGSSAEWQALPSD